MIDKLLFVALDTKLDFIFLVSFVSRSNVLIGWEQLLCAYI